RKLLGGGMRQAGVLAAAGLIALEKGPARLEEDHRNARLLAELLAVNPEVDVGPERGRTNILMVGIARTGLVASELTPLLASAGLLVSSLHPLQLRLVTHLDISEAQIREAARIFNTVLESRRLQAIS